MESYSVELTNLEDGGKSRKRRHMHGWISATLVSGLFFAAPIAVASLAPKDLDRPSRQAEPVSAEAPDATNPTQQVASLLPEASSENSSDPANPAPPDLAEPLRLDASPETFYAPLNGGKMAFFRAIACNESQQTLKNLIFSAKYDKHIKMSPMTEPRLIGNNGKVSGKTFISTDNNLIMSRLDPDELLQPGQCAQLEIIAEPDKGQQFAPASGIDFTASYEAQDKKFERHKRVEIAAEPFFLETITAAEPTREERGNNHITHLLSVHLREIDEPTPITLSASSNLDLKWSYYVDSNNNGKWDRTDEPWSSGSVLQPASSRIILRAPAPQMVDNEPWFDLTNILATASVGDDILTTEHRITSNSGIFGDTPLDVKRLIAIDRDCDGDLRDEHARDALFESKKKALVGGCLIMRLTFTNHSKQYIESLEIRDAPPSRGVHYLPNSLKYLGLPKSLRPRKQDGLAAAFAQNDVVWRFRGELAPGDYGKIEYGMKVNGE